MVVRHTDGHSYRAMVALPRKRVTPPAIASHHQPMADDNMPPHRTANRPPSPVDTAGLR
jgi:hypothetical protein